MTGFFEEKPGVKSMMRLLSYQLFWFFVLFNFLFIYLDTSTAGFHITKEFIILDFIFLIAIFVPKYLQKFAESKFADIVKQ